MIYISIIFILKLSFAFGLFIDQSGYLGCYINNLMQHEFNTFAGHLDHAKLTPQLCVKACSAIGFSLAAIEKGTMCFCKKLSGISSVKDVDSNCLSTPCIGNPLQACGSQTNLLVYGAGPLSTISKIQEFGITSLANQKLNSKSPMPIFSPIKIELDFIGVSSNLFMYNAREAIGNQDLTGVSSNYTFNYTMVNTGQSSIEFIISPSTSTSYQSSRISTSLPYVVDTLRNITLSCPSSILITDNLNCTLSFVAGTNLQANISYGDGAKDACNLMDINTKHYGGPVPKFYENNALFNMGAQVYLAANAEIKIESYLRAIELYAESAGSIQIDIMRWQCGSSSQVPRNFDYVCDSLTLSTTYSCAISSPFSTANETCSDTVPNSRFASYQSSASMSLASIATFLLNMEQGYNLFTDNNLVLDLKLLPGDLIQLTGLSGGGAVGVDMSGDAAQTDYLFNSGYLTPINSPSNWRFYIRAIVSPSNKILSVFHNYTSTGVYNVNVNLSNIFSGFTLSISQSVAVESQITGLQILTVSSSTSCFLNIACSIQALVVSGSNLKYEWTITSSNLLYQLNTTQNIISYTFNQTNNYNITVFVYNTLSNAIASATITVQADLIGLYFKAGNSSLSSSIVNQNSNFLFYLVAGANYNCFVGYGDGTYDSFSDNIYNMNNTYISHLYTSERVYTVYINCTNPVNSVDLIFNHTVQYSLVGLALTANGTSVKKAYTVKFTLLSGSAPYLFSFLFDNILDTGAIYSNLAGQSSLHSAEINPTIHQLFIYLCNYVSCVQLNATFEVSLPISGANFAIVPTNNILTGYTYLYPTQLQFRVSMLAGSNILMYINTDSSTSYSTLDNNLIQIQTYGDWFSNINDLTNRLYAINYTYSNPGDFIIFVNISNILGYVTFTQTVRVISQVNNLIPGLAGTTNNYVIYLATQSTGTAQFVFSYADNTKAGSHSSVTFWPGDASNSTFGPFPLSMDFNANVSKTQLQYAYSTTGFYQVTFYVVNPLGSQVFTYLIRVVSGMYGFYISVNPLYSPVGNPVTVSSYLMQGQGVVYTWTQNGITFATSPRSSQQFNIPDTQQYTPSTVGNYSILVKATDSYSTINDSYTLEVQNPLSSILVSVSPNTPQINIDNIAASRTFVFTINYYPSTATNVYYIINFGDNSLIKLPSFMPSSSQQISYTYATSGLFNVNITLFNKVSSFSQPIQIEIDSDFFGFECLPYWRALPTDSSIDIPYNLLNGSYYVKQEYDIRFYCTWLRLDAVPLEFDLYLNGVLMNTITTISALTKLNYTNAMGYIIPYNSSLITNQGTLLIQVKNSIFSQTSTSSIIPISVPLNVQWVDPRYSFVLGSLMAFNITFSSLGQPSCTMISFTSWSNSTRILGFMGTSKAYCTSTFSIYSSSMASLYMGTYSSFTFTPNVLTFSTTAVTMTGRYYLTANVQAPDNSIIAICNFSVVLSGACELPYVDILNKSSLFYKPQSYFRSDMIILTSTTQLNCTSGLANQKQWFLYKVNPQTGVLGTQINLSSNPTGNYAQLVIQPSTLSFGLYSVIYQVSMTYNPILYTDTAQSFFEVEPTGLAIASLPGTSAGGTYEQTIGTNQAIILDPATYSYDLDSLANISSLSFNFYCKVIDNGVEYDYPQLFYDVNLDLLTLLNDYSSNQNVQQFFNPNNSHSCFKSINDYSFDITKNKLTIRAGGLSYIANRIYQVLVQTSYLETIYYQILRFNVQNVNSVPLLSLGCKISGLCIPYGDYVKINPSTQILIDGDCQSGCTNLFNLAYRFNVYQSWYLPPKQVWYECNSNNNSGILGSNTKELVLETNLFSENPSVVIWKVEFYLTATTALNGIASGTSSILIKVNQLPVNGTCSISPSSGTSGNTTFFISCINWIDPDGYVSTYSFSSFYSSQQVTMSIGSNSIGSISSQLPVGAIYDSYNLYISVNIIDNDNGVTTYQIPNPVVVQPAESDLNSIIEQLLNPNAQNSLNSILYSGNSQLTTQTILAVSSILNGASLSDKLALSALGNYTLPTTFGPLSSYAGVVATPNLTEAQYLINQNLQAQLRQYLSNFINNISVSDINSILQQSAMLNAMTSATDSITRTMADSVTNQCIRLIQALMNVSSDTSSQDINTAAVSLTSTLGNIISGLSNYLNGRISSLNLDQDSSDALPVYYDTDLENFWTNPNNFFGDYGPDASQLQIALSKNIQHQQFLNVDIAQKVSTITDLIGNLVASRFATGQSYDMVTSSLAMQISKLQASNLPNQVNIENAMVQMPSFCDLTTNSGSTTTTTTASPYINPLDSYNCTNRIITLKSILLPMANSGHNGRNESFIGFSYSIGLSFLDQNGNEINIQNTLKPIEMHIPRDSNLLNNDYLYVNVSSSALNISLGSQFLPNALYIYAVNASLHIQIKPNDSSVGYLGLVKFGSTPILNATTTSYDFWKILCPNSADYQQVNDTSGVLDSYYLLFMNMQQVNGYRGFVGYGLRELTASEILSYCTNSSAALPTSPPLLVNTNQSLFTSNFWLKSYTSGCYYYDASTGKWSNEGMEIYSDTSLIYTHCSTNHLTQFAGGLFIVPNEINFTRVLANASPLKNPLIYVVTIVITCVYIGFWLWAFMRDRYDAKQKGIIILSDNLIGDNYCYEILVYTGNRREAATDSKVKLVINGDLDETNERLLGSKTRSIFRRGGVDSFLMAVNRPLGTLNYIRVWHDNSGQGAMASWYLRHIIVHDLQTREKFHFPCYSWLAVERSDGKIDRTLGVAGAKQLRKIEFEEKKSMRDGHLWLSMFTKPLLSPLMRVDRVECCFLMLYLFMLVNIVYYGAIESDASSGLKLGPFLIHPEQILIGILTNLFVFLLCRFLVAIFKRCKVRITKSRKLKKAIDDNMRINKIEDFSSLYKDDGNKENDECDIDSKGNKYAHNDSMPIKRFLIPWWIRPTLHCICNIVILVCAILLIFEGVNYGETQCEKWLTSLLISFIISLILWQPLQVILSAYIYVKFCKKRASLSDRQEFDFEHEFDHEDNKKSLNKYYKVDHAIHRTNPFKLTQFENSNLTQYQLNDARNSRVREVRIWQAIREISIYVVFILILFYVTYTNIGNSAFDYQNAMKNTFALSELSSVADFWTWASETMATGLRANTWYNGQQPYGLAGYINDISSRMIGYALLRQVRVRTGSCTLDGHVQPYINFCDSDYHLASVDSTDYGYSWTQFNSSYVPPNGMQQVYAAFQYQDAQTLQGYPITGDYNTYLGDGYVYQMRGSLSFLKGNLSLLQQMGWINRETRAVFVEFALYNPNINMVIVAELLIEILPTGQILTQMRFDPLNLFNEINGGSSVAFKIVAYVLYLLFIVYFMCMEIKQLVKEGPRLYFSRFWNYVEWMLIIFSMVAFALFFYRLSQAYAVLNFFRQTSGYGYIKLQIVSYWNQILTTSLGACCVFGTIRFLKLFRFYKKIYVLALTLKFCIKEILGFSIMFLFVWVAFVQMLYLYFYDKLISYSNPLNAFTTSFECLVGKFDKNLMSSTKYSLGPIIFIIYPIVMAFMMINIFITIVCEAFKEVRSDIRKNDNELEIMDYFKTMYGNWRRNGKLDRSRVNNDKYLEISQKLPQNVDRLIHNLAKVYEEDIYIDKMIMSKQSDKN